MSPPARWRIAAATALAIASIAVLAAPVAGSAAPARTSRERPSGAGQAEARPLRWRSCSGGECTNLRVPLDYAQPDGRQIKVALFRVPAREPDRRIGSLVVNPGGPGASGIDFARDAEFLFPGAVLDRFDLVGFDPRGVGGTIPVDCGPDLDRHYALDLTPDDAEDRRLLDEGMARLARACERRSGDLLPHVSTQDTVRDLDRIRAALGDEKLTYLGFSYGTYIGALYADLFPDRVRALVLDGAVDPELGVLDANLQQARGFEDSLDAFFEWCAKRTRCAFHNDGEPAGAYDRLAAQIDAEPLRVGDRALGPGEFDIGVVSTLYAGALGFETLADALAAAADGDGEPLLDQSDDYTDRDDDGRYPRSKGAFWSIGCIDGPRLGGPEAYAAAEEQLTAVAPRLGVSTLNYSLVCAYWPVPDLPSPNPLDAPGAPPIVVIGTTGDPATPVQWAEAMADQLESGVLVVTEGSTHTSFLSSDCVDRVVTRYLVRLKPPRSGTTCEGI